MDFKIELYETLNGRQLVEQELEALQTTQPVLYDLLVTGLKKLQQSEYHHPPLCAALGNGLFELRVGHKNIARAAWFFYSGRRIIVVRCFVKKSNKTPPNELRLAQHRMAEYLSRHT